MQSSSITANLLIGAKKINKMEQYKPIPKYSKYECSDMGNILNIKTKKVLKFHINKNGYKTICLCENGKRKTYTIHSLMAITFLNHNRCGNTLVVDHINNNKLDNRLTNLQIVTNRENCSKDQFRHDRSSKYVGVFYYKKTKKYRAKIKKQGKSIHLGYYTNETDAQKAYKYALEQINMKINLQNQNN